MHRRIAFTFSRAIPCSCEGCAMDGLGSCRNHWCSAASTSCAREAKSSAPSHVGVVGHCQGLARGNGHVAVQGDGTRAGGEGASALVPAPTSWRT